MDCFTGFAAVLVVFVGGFWLLAMRKQGARKSAAPGPRSAAPQLALECAPLAAEGSVEVVGESHYQDALTAISDAHGNEQIAAVLVPEPDNAYDANAVAIFIENMQVGYLGRADAAAIRPTLDAMKKSGQLGYCPAVLKGGFQMRDGTRASFGVVLRLKLPGVARPGIGARS